ncbi:hypothetical protein [Streptomyces xanthii]|uniref:Uncharacterized protein n=1 Tax=Streptomyces xanthii TaxID=2768069 RepID=A0A7H1B5I6_9ACTN|nr:hypothetical protein [Streptomyces xanthii]QNS03991.1 hypothetical protein IAG42_10390 [Streptomyces xanthii]
MKLLNRAETNVERKHRWAVLTQAWTSLVMMLTVTSMIRLGKVSLPFVALTVVSVGCALYGVHSLRCGQERR